MVIMNGFRGSLKYLHILAIRRQLWSLKPINTRGLLYFRYRITLKTPGNEKVYFSISWYLVVQHGQSRETLQDARLKEVRKDPNDGNVNVRVT